MGDLSAVDILDRLVKLGCTVWAENEKVKVEGPELPEVIDLITELRLNRDAALAFLREQESQPLSLVEVKAALPPGVTLVSYRPKPAPFAVRPVSIVTNARKFFRAYLADLAWRIEHPDGYAAPPLADILAKLADGGLELELKSDPKRRLS
jgi:hypothetical protein